MFKISIIGCLLIRFISGCVTNRVSLVDESMVSVEKQGNETVEILWTDVYQDGEDTVVYGVIRRRRMEDGEVGFQISFKISDWILVGAGGIEGQIHGLEGRATVQWWGKSQAT